MIACPDRYKMDIPDLIQKAKEHDSDAFDIIYKQYHPRMMGVCMNIVKEDRATVEDLVHDAFILAFVSIGQLRDGARLGEWLTTIVRNVALKHVEQRNRLQTMPLSAVSEEDAAFIDTSSSPKAIDCPTTLLPSALCQAIDIRSEISRQTMCCAQIDNMTSTPYRQYNKKSRR